MIRLWNWFESRAFPHCGWWEINSWGRKLWSTSCLIHICFHFFSPISLSRGLGPPWLKCKGIGKGEVLLLLLSRFSRVRLCANGLPHPWDSPGKNTGVGCHFLLQCMKVKSESEVAQSCPTLSDPMDCSLQGSSIHGIFQARVLEWGAIAFSEGEVREVEKTLTWLVLDEPELVLYGRDYRF